MIILTGMHRSGTSFAAQMIEAMGLDFGDDNLHVIPDEWNPEGYLERIDVLVLNEKLLFGETVPARAFHSKPAKKRSLFLRLIMLVYRSNYLLGDYLDILMSKRGSSLQSDLKGLSRDYLNHPIKDPRFSFTIGEWRKYVAIHKILYTFRHPYEVALSFKARYSFPLAITYWLWHKHVSYFLRNSAGLPIIFIDYNRFYGDMALEEIKRLFAFVEKPFDPTEADHLLTDVRKMNLRRNIATSSVTLPPYVEELYRKLQQIHQLDGELKPY